MFRRSLERTTWRGTRVSRTSSVCSTTALRAWCVSPSQLRFRSTVPSTRWFLKQRWMDNCEDQIGRGMVTALSFSPFSTTATKRSTDTPPLPNNNNNNNNNKSNEETKMKEKGGNTSTDTLRRIAELSRPEGKLILLSFATLALTSSTTLLLPYLSSDVIDSALLATTNNPSSSSSPPDTMSPATIAAGLFGVTAIAGTGVYIRSLLLTKAGNRIVQRIRTHLFRSLLSQDVPYYDQTPTGDILNRLSADATLVHGAVTTHAVAALRAVVISIGSISMMVHTSPTLALVSLGTLPPVFFAAKAVGRALRERHTVVQALHANATSTAENVLGGIRTVKQFGAERYELRRYTEAIGKAHTKAIEAGRTQALFDGAVHTGANGAVLVVLGYGGGMVLDGTITAGALTGFLMYSLLLAGNVGSMSGTYVETMKAVAAADRVFEVMDRKPLIPSDLADFGEDEEKENDIVSESSTRPLSVEFCDVAFTYPTRPDKTVLGPGFSLKIHPGEVMAIVGGSGSGKSTVAALLTRLYDIDTTTDPSQSDLNSNNNNNNDDNLEHTKPCILIDNHDIRTLSPTNLRSHIGIVSQEPLLFDGTIEENIRYGRRTASDEDVYEAARIAHVVDFTSCMPEGLKTQVGTRGVQLSGGQKQRVAIARLCLKDPPIAVFDEATSALDAESEHYVKEAIDTVMQGRTVISIAHRLSTIRGADRIAVIQNGLVAEVGTFDELVAKGEDHGFFCSLMKRQLLNA